jgi:hypothetical protein
MRLFSCSLCKHTVFFENVRCINCGEALAYLPDVHEMSTITPVEEQPSKPGAAIRYKALAAKAGTKLYRLCDNSLTHGVCNWAIPESDDDPLCSSCRLNDVVPNLALPGALDAWRRLEVAKRRLYYSLNALGLPIESRVIRPEAGLMFSFMQDGEDGKKVFTGHSDGLITINIEEADDPLREKLKKSLGEGYRTLIGHFRHEIGHYYWDRLVKDSVWLPACRSLFGDETADYAESLKHHYEHGAPADWPLRYVSAYATMHPWEDWAETWAHYLHMVDTLTMAGCYGLVLNVNSQVSSEMLAMNARQLDFENFQALIRGWVPLTVALNSLNRSMGIVDPYPFVLTPEIVRKINFVHDLIEHWDADDATRGSVLARWRPDAYGKPPAESLPVLAPVQRQNAPPARSRLGVRFSPSSV